MLFEEADRQVRAWVRTALSGIRNLSGDLEVGLGPPDPNQRGPGVSSYLLAVTESPPVRLPPSTTVRLECHYLITTFADTPEEAHLMLGHLAVASLEQPDWVRDFQRIPEPTWAAFGVAPQPAFVLRVPVSQEQVRPVPRVLEPLGVELDSELRSFRGVLLGPGGRPIVHASVELTDLQLTTQTDLEGRFIFPAVPSRHRTRRLRIRAKGRVFDRHVEHPQTDDREIEILLDDLFERKE